MSMIDTTCPSDGDQKNKLCRAASFQPHIGFADNGEDQLQDVDSLRSRHSVEDRDVPQPPQVSSQRSNLAEKNSDVAVKEGSDSPSQNGRKGSREMEGSRSDGNSPIVTVREKGRPAEV